MDLNLFQRSNISSIDFFLELKRAQNRAEAAAQEVAMATAKLREKEIELQNLSHEYEKVQLQSVELIF